MAPSRIRPEDFYATLESELARAVGAHEEALMARWGRTSVRTHILKGDAVRGGPTRDREASVLTRTMNQLGYWPGERTGKKYLAFERYRMDLVALDCNWDDEDQASAAWHGRWTVTLVCELENDIRELELTIRGMLDIRSLLYVGIFCTDEPDPELGAEPWYRRDAQDEPKRLSEWKPPTMEGSGILEPLPEGTELLVATLSTHSPRLHSAYLWKVEGGQWKGPQRVP